MSLLNEINQILGENELNIDGHLDDLANFIDNDNQQESNVNVMKGGNIVTKSEKKTVNELIFKNIHPYYYKLFKHFLHPGVGDILPDGVFEESKKTKEYEIYKTLVNDDPNYTKISRELVGIDNWFCENCKGKLNNTNRKLTKDTYDKHFSIMSDPQNKVKCYMCGNDLKLEGNPNLNDAYKRFFLPSLLTKSIECPLILDKNFLNYAYYHNVKETTKSYNDSLKKLLDEDKRFFNIGYFEKNTKLSTTDINIYNYKYNGIEGEYDDKGNTFSKDMHFINNINILTGTDKPDRDTIRGANTNCILFIIIDHGINTYFEDKNIDLRLVLLFEKTGGANTTTISDKMTFALLNIKKEYKKYVMNNVFINEIIAQIPNIKDETYITKFCKDKIKKLFKENDDNVIFDFNNTRIDPKYNQGTRPDFNREKEIEQTVRTRIEGVSIIAAAAAGPAPAAAAAAALTAAQLEAATQTTNATALEAAAAAAVAAGTAGAAEGLSRAKEDNKATVRACDCAIRAVQKFNFNGGGAVQINSRYQRVTDKPPKLGHVTTVDQRNDNDISPVKKETGKILTEDNLKYKGINNSTIRNNLAGHKSGDKVFDEQAIITSIIHIITKNKLSKLIKVKSSTSFKKNKVYNLELINDYIEGEYLYDIITIMENIDNIRDDDKTFKFNDTVIISSSLFKDILINYILRSADPAAGGSDANPLKTYGLITGGMERDFNDISINKYLLLNRKDILLEQKIFPKYPFFYHLLDDGDPSLCITTNDNKIIPISPNLFYGSMEDNDTFYCKENLHKQIIDKFLNLDKIIRFSSTIKKHPLSSDNT